ncbi:hypothetical protein BDV59DRAFT_205194 [Aspergillus ambiguus]|uniref:uncharacterized protein n=1 Tax=Aspergillus ambiguus TaxID=176160 RepID=UPI003CCD8BE3
MSFSYNGGLSSIGSNLGLQAEFQQQTPTGRRPQERNASRDAGKRQNNGRRNKRGQNNKHPGGHRRDSINDTANKRRCPREPMGNTDPQRATNLGRYCVSEQTPNTIRSAYRNRRNQRRGQRALRDIDMPDAPLLDGASEDVIMQEPPALINEQGFGEQNQAIDAVLLGVTALNINRDPSQRDFDGDIIMDADPLV